MADYSYARIVDGDVDSVVERVTEALKTEGFGVLTTIDVRETLKKKLDVDFRPYRILGACNPPLAHQALQGEAGVGVLLPCNVVVSEDADGTIAVSAIDPKAMFSVVNTPGMEPIVEEVRTKLQNMLEAL